MRRGQALIFAKLIALLSVVSLVLASCASSPAPAGGGQPSPAAQSAATPTTAAAKTSTAAGPTPAGAANTLTTASAAQDPCPYLSKQEVESAIGKSVFDADFLDTGEALRSCSYRDPQSPASIVVGVIVRGGSVAKLDYESGKNNTDDKLEVNGIGEDAYWSPSAHNLEFLSGSNAVILTVNDGSVQDQMNIAQDLGPKVLARLGSQPSAQSSGTSGAALDGCSLLTKEEVEAVVGKTVELVKQSATGGMIGCSYQIPELKPLSYVDLTVWDLTPTEAKGMHEATKGGDRDQVAVPGIGDDAYWDNTFGSLSMLNGKYAIDIKVSETDVTDPQKAAQALAPNVLARLP